ncbi:MAG: S8 family serine peptidase, partial [Acidobacteriota bacterium]
MAHPDDRACLQGRTLFEMELDLARAPAGALAEDEEPVTVEVRRTRFDPPYLVRRPPRKDDPGEESSWAVATNLLVTMERGVAPGDAEEILRELASYGDPGAISVRTEPLPLPGLYLVERRQPADFEAEDPRFLLTRVQEFLEHEAVAEVNPDSLYFSFPEPRAVGAPPWPPDSELERMRVPGAHDAGATGDRRVRVAVLDTGVETLHEALWRNILREDGRVVGYDFDRDRPDVQDGNGHGTYCAGLIGGAGYGVNREVSIL